MVQVPIQGFVSCNWVIVFGWGFRENALTNFALLSMYNKNIRWASSPSAANLSTLFSNAIINKILIIIIVLVIIIIISLNGILMILIQGQVRSEMQSDCAMKTNTFALRHFHFQLSKTRKNKSKKQIHPRIKSLTNNKHFHNHKTRSFLSILKNKWKMIHLCIKNRANTFIPRKTQV